MSLVDLLEAEDPGGLDFEPAGRGIRRDLLQRHSASRETRNSEDEAAEECQIDAARHLKQWVEVGHRNETAQPAVRRHAFVALHGPRQPNVLIQSTMAFPISSGESS